MSKNRISDVAIQHRPPYLDRERSIANQAWLQRVPDDPGGLLRRKFALEHQRREREGRR